MILDYYKNYRTYVNAVPGLEEGMAFVQTLLGKPTGTYRTETEMYAMVQEGDTYDISSDLMETHRKFLDVQFVFSGQEFFEWEEAEQLEIETPYEEETDFVFYKGSGKSYRATPGMFYILFPHDAHKCRGAVNGQSERYRKIVLKLPVS
ncbi:MAG: DUF386 domain-containing protein [Lachnospiraceae bacterium]|jgi:biofilm protein TabA|nr:DUF386 domain-containing protein [Lachnospiraceae bacterium]MCI9306664.1 DUF386 domain-containing protein [Lachnospiraceae bacterium]